MKIDPNKRYLRLTPTGGVSCWGRRLKDVERTGAGIIVDYKMLRWARAPHYPPTRYLWTNGFKWLGDTLRRHAVQGATDARG